jgi:hypothetical protein
MKSNLTYKRILIHKNNKFTFIFNFPSLFFFANILSHGIKCLLELFYQLRWNIVIVQGLFKVVPCHIKLCVSDVHFLVGFFHVSTIVIVRSSSYHSNEHFLLMSLLLQICFCKKWSSNRVS